MSPARPHPCTTRAAQLTDAQAIAALHSRLFHNGWREADVNALLSLGTTVAEVIEDGANGGLLGFLIAQRVEDEAEILAFGIDREWQRRGLGRLLLEAMEARLSALGVGKLMLEVAVDNHAALALYCRHGFRTSGRRAAYYSRQGGTAVDAVLKEKPL